MTQVRAIKVNHLNAVLADFDRAKAHFTGKYDATYFLTPPTQDATAGLFEIGHVIFEMFVPKMWLLNARYGAHYLGVEFQVESLADGRAALAEQGIAINRDIGTAVHSDPADFHGVSLEFYEGEFHETDYGPIQCAKLPGAAWWAAHPLRLSGLKALTWAVRDAALVQGRLAALIGAMPVGVAERPVVGGRATMVAIADTVVELLEPTGPGVLADHLERWGEGLRSTVLGSHDMAAVRRWGEERGLPLEPGTADGWLQVPAAANEGIIIEFAPA
jgi:hypothetical protein